ncbi:MAG: HAD hydrolase-like protein [Candidatus Aenigmarchaeota archaeon]|nr:HAD hydrolase-like protein [Candidatus Aenigmarchaeota archaeon]
MLELEATLGVVVDLCGVCIYDGFPPTVTKIGKRLGIENDVLQQTKDKYWIPFSLGEMSPRDFWYAVFKENGKGFTDSELDRINYEVLESHYPYAYVMKWFRNLRGHFKIGLATNSPRPWLEWWDKKYSLSQTFDVILIPSDIGVRKPDYGYWEELVDRMRMPPELIEYKDDQDRMVRGARLAGLKADVFNPNSVAPVEVLVHA